MSPWNNTSDRIWYPGPSGLGGNGSDGSSGGCVTDGPFSRSVWRKTNGRCLRRRFSGEKQLIPTFSILFFFFSSPAPNPANISVLSLARIWRTQERLMNRVRSFLSMPSMLPAGSALTIGLSIKGCSHSKNQFGERKKIDQSRSSSCGDLKGLTRYRQSLFFSSSIKATKGEFAGRVSAPFPQCLFCSLHEMRLAFGCL